MKLIVLYGPPGVGKLTVAKELSRITGFKIFHNHLSNDLISSVLEFGTPHFWKLVNKTRIDVLRHAAKHDVDGVIYTFCYYYKEDDRMVKRMLSALKKHKTEFHFVHLMCSKQALYGRIKEESRKKFGKIKKRSTLDSLFKKHEMYKSIPFVKNLVIETTTLSPRRTALQIKKTYKL